VSIKDVRSQGEVDLSSVDILRRFVQLRTSALFGEQHFGFFEIYGVSARTRGVEPVQTFCGQGEGVNFSLFCADVFYERSRRVKYLKQQIKNFKSLNLRTSFNGEREIKKCKSIFFIGWIKQSNIIT